MLGKITTFLNKNKMKRTALFNLLIVGLVFVFGVTACKKRPVNTTDIPRLRPIVGDNGRGDLPEGGKLPGNNSENNPVVNRDGTGIEQANRGSIGDRPQNRSMFAADTVYFDLDSAAVKAGEKSKLESVASGFKSQANGDLLIEGHCDERGTEGYNLTLGDKRANSLREYLVNLGVSAERIHTISYGESRPASEGHDESSWSKNRRGEFIFVEPAK